VNGTGRALVLIGAVWLAIGWALGAHWLLLVIGAGMILLGVAMIGR
jgi:hypothetical protein